VRQDEGEEALMADVDRLYRMLEARTRAAAAGVETRHGEGARLDPFDRLVSAGLLRIERGWLSGPWPR